MPSRYRRDAARLKAEIVARVEAGETVHAVCASPEMPSEHTVRNWAQGDVAFGEALAAARRRGDEREPGRSLPRSLLPLWEKVAAEG